MVNAKMPIPTIIFISYRFLKNENKKNGKTRKVTKRAVLDGKINR